ncbi:MAG TPA: HNH endonuclease [Caldithrix abyssi]|uniref:HNH endonuclease n=1 Tax=Caldithrix abyssi TaxID=187145 RepID=A0A7V5UDX4_CALAY|nr:HNH endonuclease [Caldithrix abyssi]
MLGRKVLILNQNYEPITICSMKRAIILVYLKKVQMVERYECSVRSVSVSMPCPSIIRLNSYVRKPFREVILNRKNILKRDQNICQYCGKNSRPMTIDHVIPKSYGGKDTWENLVCACYSCNAKKSNRTPEEAGMKLLRRPRKPSHLFYLQNLIGNPPESWKPYLFL